MPKAKLPFTWPFDQSKYMAVDTIGNIYHDLYSIKEPVAEGISIISKKTGYCWWWDGKFRLSRIPDELDLHLEPIESIDDFDPLEWLEKQIEQLGNGKATGEFNRGWHGALKSVSNFVNLAREMRDKKKEV